MTPDMNIILVVYIFMLSVLSLVLIASARSCFSCLERTYTGGSEGRNLSLKVATLLRLPRLDTFFLYSIRSTLMVLMMKAEAAASTMMAVW